LRQKRDQLRDSVVEHVRDHKDVLSIIAGDFNWVTDKEDRWTLRSSEWSGLKDASEQKDWIKKVEDACSFSELWQPHATHKDGNARSRLDRIYTTQHSSDQLDMQLGCAPLDWQPKLSNHRPVLFFRKVGSFHCHRVGPLPSAPLRNDNWAWRVKATYLGQLDEIKGGEGPWQRLAILKRAIVDTTWNMQEELSTKNLYTEATEKDDKVGWTMRMGPCH